MVVPFGVDPAVMTLPAQVVREERSYVPNSLGWGLQGMLPTQQPMQPADKPEQEEPVAASQQELLLETRRFQTGHRPARKPDPAQERRYVAALSTPSFPAAPSGADSKTQQVLRAHYLPQILSDLQKIQPHCGQASAAMYADRLLRTLRTLRDAIPTDPFVEVATALHDALALQNNWADCDAGQFDAARTILKTAAKKEKLTDQHIEKAIIDLEAAGFDTTPFGMDSDTQLDEEAELA